MTIPAPIDAIWSGSIFARALEKVRQVEPKKKKGTNPPPEARCGSRYLYNSTLQVMVGRTFVKYSITGVKGFRHIFLPNLLSIPQFDYKNVSRLLNERLIFISKSNALSLRRRVEARLMEYMASDVPRGKGEAHLRDSPNN